MKKHWKDSVTNLHRIYKVAEYLFKEAREQNDRRYIKRFKRIKRRNGTSKLIKIK